MNKHFTFFYILIMLYSKQYYRNFFTLWNIKKGIVNVKSQFDLLTISSFNHIFIAIIFISLFRAANLIVRVFTLNCSLICFNSIWYLFFYGLDDLRDSWWLKLFRVDLCLLDVFSPQDQFESVLYLRFSAALHNVSNLSPFISEFKPLLKELLIFFECPLTLFYWWINSC